MKSGLAPQRLVLEITERILMDNSAEIIQKLGKLKKLGLRIALDDFGTGFSSLSYLRSFPFDKIKIDRCFITEMQAGSESSAIIEAVLDLASKLNMQTIAEGVESEEQLASLRALGCEQVQGYLISRAIPAADLPITRRFARQDCAIEAVTPLTPEYQPVADAFPGADIQEARRA